MNYYAIIPARYASTRLPGKPLLNIGGKPMFWHVYTKACLCPLFTKVIVATDHELILSKAKQLGVDCILTDPNHASGTDRSFEVAKNMAKHNDIIVNIQGDEPLLDPQMLTELLDPFQNPTQTQTTMVSTLARPITYAEALSPHVVKVAMTKKQQAVYFSRSLIPYQRDIDPKNTSYLGHVGLYAFKMQALEAFVHSPPSSLELQEKLEQLRFFELGIPIHISLTKTSSQGVDTPEDLELVRQIIAAEKAIVSN